MKKMFFSLAVFTAMFLMVGCGGNDIESSRGYGYSECSYGSYKCKGGDSYWCGYTNGSNDLIWQLSERCSYSCDDYTGKCTSGSSGENGGGNSGGGNSGGGNSGGSNAAYQTCCDLAYCFDACSDQNCYDNCVNNSSSVAINDYNYIFECGDIFGCDPDGDGYYDSSCLSTYCGSYLTSCCYAVDNSGGNGEGGSSGGNGGGGSTAQCSSGQYTCNGSDSYYCSGGSWILSANCSYGCNSSTGQCKSSSSGGGSTSECSYGDYKCQGSSSYKCSTNGSWQWNQDCSYGCDLSKGKCQECSTGDYKCSGSYSYYCSCGYWKSNEYCSYGCNVSTGTCKECSSGKKCQNSYSYSCSNGFWTADEYCSNGCNSSTGKCNSSSGGGSTTGNKPCISDFNGAYSGTDSTYLELHWSLTQTGNCGEADKITIQVQVGSSSTFKTLVSRTIAYSYDTYSFDAEPYFYSDSYPSVGLILNAENSYGSTSWVLTCLYDDDHWGTYDICETI